MAKVSSPQSSKMRILKIRIFEDCGYVRGLELDRFLGQHTELWVAALNMLKRCSTMMAHHNKSEIFHRL